MNKLDEKYFFLHIEKTAGTSLVEYLKHARKDTFQYIHPDKLEDENFLNNEFPNFSVIAGHIGCNLAMKYMKDFYKITFLRNPIDRVLSFYYYAKEIPKTYDPITVKSKDLNMIDFFEFCKESNERRFVNGMTFKLSDNHGKDELLNAKRNLEKIDFIGIQENFNESLMMLSYVTNLGIPKSVPFENKTKNRSFVPELPKTVVDKIVELNQKDIELYNYALELYEKQKTKVLYSLLEDNFELKKLVFSLYFFKSRNNKYIKTLFGTLSVLILILIAFLLLVSW